LLDWSSHVWVLQVFESSIIPPAHSTASPVWASDVAALREETDLGLASLLIESMFLADQFGRVLLLKGSNLTLARVLAWITTLQQIGLTLRIPLFLYDML
jgi:hypothetical protein